MTINKNTIILGLEGGMAAGKTSCAKVLSKQGFIKTEEYMEYIHRDLYPYFGNWPPAMRLRFLSDVDSSRVGLIGEHPNVALDRTYLTYLSHDYAVAKLGKPAPVSEYHIDRILSGAKPTHLVFLTVNPVERQKRLDERTGSAANYLTSTAFNDALKDFFWSLSQSFPILFLDTSSVQTVEVASKCMDWISGEENWVSLHAEVAKKSIELIRDA